MNARLSALACVALELIAASAATAQVDQPDYLYPDLIPFVREDQRYLQNWFLEGDELRVETVFANVGDGLLQLRLDPESVSGGTADVYQRVFIGTDNGPQYEDFFANRSVYHRFHGHLHFDDFSEFQLRAVTVETDGTLGVGDLVAAEVKTSFLIRDGLRLPDSQWADAPSYPSSHFGRVQNISVGYGDVYGHFIEGQAIPVAGVERDALYWLRQTVDPANALRETNEANNSVAILIDLREPETARFRSDGRFVQPGDFYPVLLGDLDFDQNVTSDDWLLFREGAGTSLDGLGEREAYLAGDLNLDGRHSPADFLLFRQSLERSMGAAKSDGRAVPEPCAMVLGAVAATLALLAWGRAARPGAR